MPLLNRQYFTIGMWIPEEGNISIVEVINAEIYHLEAKVNFIQSKLNAQIVRSGLERARGEGSEFLLATNN